MKPSKQKRTRVKAGTSARAAAHRRRLFVDAYIANGGNATQAAITAGYSPKTANEQAARLLADVSLRAEIARRQAALAERHELKTEEVLRAVSRIVHADPGELYDRKGRLLPIHRLPEHVRTTIAALEYDDRGRVIKVRFWDKNSAIEKAMKHLGLFKEDNAQRTDPIRELLELVNGAKGSRGIDHVKEARR